MLFAALGDIHGNLPALRAVLCAIEKDGIKTILNTGDLVAGFPFPAEVIDLVRTRGIQSVQGEMDRLAAAFLRKAKAISTKYSPQEVEHLRWSHEHTPSADIEYLRGLPKQHAMRLEGRNVFLCHGSPSSQTDSLPEDDCVERFRRQRELTNADIIVCGKTHQPFVRRVDDTLFVNPGSVGVRAGLASYAVVNTRTDEETCSAELRSAEYDTTELHERLLGWELQSLWPV